MLERLLDGDPLELRARCEERIARQAFLLSLDRLHLRVLARTAYAAPRYRGEEPLDTWLAERIGASLRELLEEDTEALRSELPNEGTEDPVHASVSAMLGIEPGLARKACVAFNGEPYRIRRAFMQIVMARKSVEEYVSEGNGTRVEVRSALRRAFRALGLDDDPMRFVEEEEGGYDV